MIDISKLSYSEVAALRDRCDEQLAALRTSAAEAIRAKLMAEAEANGLDWRDIVNGGAGRRRRNAKLRSNGHAEI